MFVKSILFVQTVKPFNSNVHVVKSHDVVLQLMFLCKLGFTFRAFVFGTVGMRSNMPDALELLSKLFPAYLALERFFTRVFAMMSLHIHPLFCCIARGGNAEKWAFYWYIINLKHLAEIVC